MTLYPYLSAVMGLGAPEILLILFLILILFGAKRLPELAKGMGKSIKEFKKAATEVEEDLRSAMEEEPKRPSSPPPPKPTQTPVASSSDTSSSDKG